MCRSSSPSPTSSPRTTSSCCDAVERPQSLQRDRGAARRARGRHRHVGGLPRPRRAGDRRGGRRPRRRRSTATISPTSSSPRARPASRRARCSRTRRASAPTTRGPTSSGLREGDRYLIVNPFFHSFGLKAGILASIITGATIVPHAVFDVDTVMQRVAEEQISMLPGPPTVYQSILDHPRVGEFDMSSLRLSVTGAAAVPVEMINRMRAELGFETIVTGYGLTECTGIATMCRHDDDPVIISTTSRPRDPRHRGRRSSTTRAQPLAAGRAGRGRGARLQRHARVHPRSRGDRGGDRRRRLAAHRRHRR